MTTAQKPETAVKSHPFVRAFAASDVDALVESLAPDVILHSAVTSYTFEGREMMRDLYASVIESFEQHRVTDELRNADTHVFYWEGRIDGRDVNGADRLKLDAEGKVREVTVLARPLTGLATFLTGIGYRLARRRRGGLVAAVLRLTALPLAPLFSLFDPLTAWIARGRSRG